MLSYALYQQLIEILGPGRRYGYLLQKNISFLNVVSVFKKKSHISHLNLPSPTFTFTRSNMGLAQAGDISLWAAVIHKLAWVNID